MRKHRVDSGTFGSFLFHDIAAADDGCEPMAINKKDSLIIGVLQRPAGAQHGHDDDPLPKICFIAQTKPTGGPAFRRGRWSEFLYGVFGL
jgi:hypothetical protein